MICRILVLFVIAAASVSCASFTPEFQSWEGLNSVIEGRGGTRIVVDGMDVWTHGDPPRRYRVLGIMQDKRPAAAVAYWIKHDIVPMARQSGGDAVILVLSQPQVTGYSTFGNATAYGYGNFSSAFGSSTTVPITRRTSTFVVIKYV